MGDSISVGPDIPQELNKRGVSQLSWGLTKNSIKYIHKFEHLKLCFNIVFILAYFFSIFYFLCGKFLNFFENCDFVGLTFDHKAKINKRGVS